MSILAIILVVAFLLLYLAPAWRSLYWIVRAAIAGIL